MFILKNILLALNDMAWADGFKSKNKWWNLTQYTSFLHKLIYVLIKKE